MSGGNYGQGTRGPHPHAFLRLCGPLSRHLVCHGADPSRDPYPVTESWRGPKTRPALLQRKAALSIQTAPLAISGSEADLALSRFRDFCCEILFYLLDAFTDFEAHETGDLDTRFLGGNAHGQIGIHDERLAQQCNLT